MSTAGTLRELVDQHADQQADKYFLIAPDTQRNMSYAALQQHALEVSATLAARGIGKGDKVAMLLDNGYWTTVIMLGVMYSGAVIVPMNAVAGGSVLDYVLEHSDAQLLYISPHYAEKYPNLSDKIPTVSVTDGSSPFPAINLPAPEALPELSSADHAVLIYTSGTTGRPKGVLLSHRNVIAGGRNTARAHQLSKEDRGLCVLPLYHINAEIVSIFGSLVSGGSVVLPKRFSVSGFWTCLADNQCTWFSLVPTIVAYLLDHEDREPMSQATRHYIKDQVRFGRSASAPLSPDMHKDFEQKFAVSLIETMGLTETSAQILSNPLPPGHIKYGSPGIAFGNEAKIVNEQGQDCAPDVPGELWIRGENVMAGYYKNPEATRDAVTADNWLRTGDLARQDTDGYFFITGRLKELIIKGGENISPREIDEVLCGHPAVLEAAAYAIPHRQYGQEVMACVVMKQDQQADAQALRDYVEQQLGAFKTPQQVRIVSELPKGPSGKVQRLKLVDLAD